jgi:hypothetical protein
VKHAVDDADSNLPMEILHNCQWFNPADNDDPFLDANFLYYRFNGVEEEEVIVPVDLSDPYAAKIVNPAFGNIIDRQVLNYLRKRFEVVEQSTEHCSVKLWDGWE